MDVIAIIILLMIPVAMAVVVFAVLYGARKASNLVTIWHNQKQFRDGPIGQWCTEYGGGEDMAHGVCVEFRPDGVGELERWDLGEESKLSFKWRSVEPMKVEIITEDALTPQVVQLNFQVVEGPYGANQVVMTEKDAASDPSKRCWLLAEPLVLKRTFDRAV
ncbi:MAG TPA: hypothetical protein VEK08_25510 [Planctomycetota bacterium]|nr:hypothetical protein [Planctomycetota bacterium]